MTSGQAPSPPPSSVPRPSGLVLSPFRALRYEPGTDLSAVTSPPYDVIDADGVEALERSSEHNAVRLILPRDTGGEGDRYEGAARALRSWVADGVLRYDDSPALYVYEQGTEEHSQRGLLGAVALTPPEDGIVLPHESTMTDTVSDRLALYEAVEADLEPVFLVYSGGGAATQAVAGVDGTPPVVDAVLGDGLRHRLWALTDPSLLEAVAADLNGRVALIADGHHRYATYLQRQARAHAAGKGLGPWDQGLVLLVDTTSFGPQVHATHRVVRGRSVTDLAERSVALADVEVLDGRGLDAALQALHEAGTGAFLLASGDAGTLRLLTRVRPDALAATMPERSQAWRALDVSVLHHGLLPAWDVPDVPEEVGYEHDVQVALARAADSGGAAVLLNPTTPEAVAAVAEAGERMPRKSTLFTPKPRTGVVIRDHRV